MTQQSISQVTTNPPSQQACPQCQAPIPVNPEFVSWCDKCDWNLKPDVVAQDVSVFDSLYLKLGQRLGQDLLDTMLAKPTARPRITVSVLLAVGVAALVHLSTLLFAMLGLVLLVQDWPNVFLIASGLLCLAIAWKLRPEFSRMPSDIASPQDFPTLYAITNRVAQHLGAQPVSAIAVDRQFNASFSQIGLRRRSVVRIGLPLFAILTSEEKVALLAHEVAHGVNHDPLRGWFVGTAVNTLKRWTYLLKPTRPRVGDGSEVGCLAVMSTITSRLVLGVLSIVPWLLGYVLVQLLWRDSQRAEYLADSLAARASGTTAMLGLLEKLRYIGTFEHIVQQLALGRPKDGQAELVPALRQRVAALPARELERLRRVELFDDTLQDASYPPKTYRVRYLQAHPVTHPAVQIWPDEAARLERELLALQPRIQRELVDAYRNQL
ncbi:MAG: hypothetical protein OHK0022_39010 [Roseiflexaceae bacterium]